MVLEGLGAHGLREEEPRRRERAGSHTAVHDHVGLRLAGVRVGADGLLRHLPAAPLVQDPPLLGDLEQDTVVRYFGLNQLPDPLVPFWTTKPQGKLP